MASDGISGAVALEIAAVWRKAESCWRDSRPDPKGQAGIDAPLQLVEWQTVKIFGEVRNAIAHRSGHIDRLADDPKSVFGRLEKQNFELKSDLRDQSDAQIMIGEHIVTDAFRVYRTILLAAAGLSSDFVMPWHCTPSGNTHGDAW